MPGVQVPPGFIRPDPEGGTKSLSFRAKPPVFIDLGLGLEMSVPAPFDGRWPNLFLVGEREMMKIWDAADVTLVSLGVFVITPSIIVGIVSLLSGIRYELKRMNYREDKR